MLILDLDLASVAQRPSSRHVVVFTRDWLDDIPRYDNLHNPSRIRCRRETMRPRLFAQPVGVLLCLLDR